MIDNDMTWVDHFEELRKRLIVVLIFFVLAMVLGFLLASPIVEYLKNDPVASQITWHVFGISDALRIYLQVAFVIALIITSPIFLYQIWAFVSPGLHPKERRALGMYIPFAVLLLLIGLAFGYYFLFPKIFGFLTGFSHALGAEETYGMTQYFQFMFNLVIPIGVLFELPIIIMFLTTIRLVNPVALAKFRKYALLLSVVVASMITPPDFVSHLSAAIPLFCLYEISIWLSRWIYRKQKAKDDAAENGSEEEFATIDLDD